MHSTKRRLKKPLYKKFLSLRKNISNSEKFLKFRRQKWQRFRHQILKNKKKSFYNPTAYVLFNFKNFFSKKFKYNLQNKQRLSYFYGGFKQTYLKKLVNSSVKNSKNSNAYIATLLIEQLEMRLDSILYRAHFCFSFSNAKQLISHRKVYVNNKIIQHHSYELQKGDLITFDKNAYDLITRNILNSKCWPTVPKHFYVNYKTLEILIIDDIKYTNHVANYPFFIDFNSFIQYYKK